ncbi:MAG TPA: ThuA domain-containing protein [Planctomycetota bacterium]|nr:ThuA domain-containing protein [Planctomycetota bacterium]
MRLSKLCLLPCLALAVAPLVPQESPKKARVLLVTGDDVPAHDWRSTTPVTREILEESKRFEVVVAEDPAILESSTLSRYDLILLNYRNPPEQRLSELARNNLAAFVRGGKGLAAIHFAVSAWGDWPEFQKLIGRVWLGKKASAEKHSGHGPKGSFQVRVTAKDHPIARGLQDFEIDDELYARLAGDGPMDVIATAFSEKFSNQDEPMAWTVRHGEGRVFVTVLGHDAAARKTPGFRTLLVQGCEWASHLR